MASSTNCIKRFLYSHSHVVDFLSASLIIVICFVVLLPKVHESFQPKANYPDHLPQETSSIASVESPTTAATTTITTTETTQDNHNHHHHDTVPIGEVLICAGFFAFYCIGLGLSKSEQDERGALYLQERRVSTTCCSSTRCPIGQREILDAEDFGEAGSISADEELDNTPLFNERNTDGNCVMLLNKHHNHHTHSRHHAHQTLKSNDLPGKKRDYGATLDANVGKSSTVYVEEIRITGKRQDNVACLNWPLSAKVTLFGLILAAALTLFDIQGLLQTIKVFRAAATGALLYVAFFLVMPKSSAGCNSCKEEEQV